MGVPLVVWKASIALSKWFDSNPDMLSGDYESGLELGSGTGLLGIYALKRILQNNPKAKMIFTDMEESVNISIFSTLSLEPGLNQS